MPVYAVITAKPEPLVESLLAAKYAEKHYKYSDTAWIVATPDSAATLSISLGGKQKLPDGGLIGALDGYLLVSELTPNYWGFSNQAFWNWLKQAHEGRI
ncbi:MAG TPA: hypothetical protein VE053_04285 [Allosphingosinicella sp.]|nr:hypothetical protein [Allosphingosinicella sp.]